MKRWIALLLAFLMTVSLVACGEDAVNTQSEGTSKEEETSALQELAQEESAEEADDSANYPDVDGYPLTKDGVNYCKVFINGTEYFLDGFTHEEDSDCLFFSPTPIIYDLNGDCIGCSSGGKSATCFDIGGSLAVMADGYSQINIDGTLYDDHAPESLPHEQYGNIDYCTTFFLEKMLDASVHFSPNHGAAYIETGKTVTEESSRQYDLKLTAEGVLTATHKENGSVIKLGIDGTYSVSDSAAAASSGGSSSSGKNSSTYQDTVVKQCPSCMGSGTIRCSTCMGSGTTMRSVNVMDPVTHTYTPRMEMGTCPSCAGRGSWSCTYCGGSGRLK